jgi:hypothetical protein
VQVAGERPRVAVHCDCGDPRCHLRPRRNTATSASASQRGGLAKALDEPVLIGVATYDKVEDMPGMGRVQVFA